MSIASVGSSPASPNAKTYTTSAALVETAGSGLETVRFTLGSISTPVAFTVAGVVLSTSTAVITAPSTGAFYSSVKNTPHVGDVVTVTSGTGTLAGGTTVLAVDDPANPTQITLSATPTGAGTATLTFTPQAPTGDYAAIQAVLPLVPSQGVSGAKDSINLVVNVYRVPGTGNQVTPAIADMTLVGSVTVPINFTDFLIKQRN